MGEDVGKGGKGPSYKLLVRIKIGLTFLALPTKFQRDMCISLLQIISTHICYQGYSEPGAGLGGVGDIYFFASYIFIFAFLHDERILPF